RSGRRTTGRAMTCTGSWAPTRRAPITRAPRRAPTTRAPRQQMPYPPPHPACVSWSATAARSPTVATRAASPGAERIRGRTQHPQHALRRHLARFEQRPVTREPDVGAEILGAAEPLGVDRDHLALGARRARDRPRLAGEVQAGPPLGDGVHQGLEFFVARR